MGSWGMDSSGFRTARYVTEGNQKINHWPCYLLTNSTNLAISNSLLHATFSQVYNAGTATAPRKGNYMDVSIYSKYPLENKRKAMSVLRICHYCCLWSHMNGSLDDIPDKIKKNLLGCDTNPCDTTYFLLLQQIRSCWLRNQTMLKLLLLLLQCFCVLWGIKASLLDKGKQKG